MKKPRKVSLNIGKSIDRILTDFTDFERAVLKACLQIPFGQVRSYKWIAKTIGRPKAVRAVGQALKKNPLPLLIPCHRVVASGGRLGGYSLGIELKAQLLKFEQELSSTDPT